MKRAFACALIVPLVSICTSACTTSSEGLSQLEKRVQVLEQETKDLKAQISQQKSTADTQSTASAAATTSPASVADAATAGGAPVFSDIGGVFGEKEIKDLAKLGVFQDISGTFKPTEPVTRAEFVCWLVRANNAMKPKSELIRLSEPGTASSFKDLQPSYKYFAYIQGMNDAGWSVGYPDKTFKPEKALTREEMIGIKVPLDHGSGAYTGYEKKWTDGDKISSNFKESMSDEAFGDPNWGRVFGNTKSCLPQKSVSRAEAALCIWQIGWHHKYHADKPEAGA